MIKGKQDHTKQYLHDLNKAKELRSQMEILEEELKYFKNLSPCPVEHCQLHPTIAENPQMEIEQPFQVIEKRHTAKRKKFNEYSRNNGLQ
ncbi:hypothetical protein HNY73_017540 [Argiope bruennichi]|uniref:Uncharacterized protein n=1 Tax=Argiope bruennichi TaxID=94029 RepID=A0A8T0EE04_ARGBR|nr:hypothetical protein HNY73_017540 [Argiope bruennichi]